MTASLSFSQVILYLTIFLSFFSTIIASSETLSIDFYHHFSDENPHKLSSTWHPEEVLRGSVEYYNTLLRNDLNRHRRRSLAEGDQYSFTVEGNQTTQFYDAMHYAYVELGTPSQTFFVLLDTGSHFFWLPCNCQKCAPSKSPSYGDMNFKSYMPNTSSTSKTITCGDKQCDRRFKNNCLNKNANCSYSVYYASPASTSGVLMQDVLLFTNERNNTDIQLPVVFGCGEIQDGDLLDQVPNGLMGLGLDSLSVPTMLAKSGIISDSFSMCFRADIGRINFGDIGNPGQYETPLIVKEGYPYYNINVTRIVVGNETLKGKFTAIVDSGTNYALLEDPFYTLLGSSFSAQVNDRRLNGSDIPLDYCFESSNPNPTNPNLSFITKGQNPFPILHPLVFLTDENNNQIGYCLAMFQSTDGNVIGDIFMTGLNVVFNREKLVLGWQEADCYGAFTNKTFSSFSSSSPSPSPSPSPIGPPTKSSGQHVIPYIILNTLIFLFEFCL
ncbi:hypothetical protein LUZ60_007110 [Juncus effusus]|nr:hypothetical protein LUZ60_007110 [Juncus effusus]